MKSEILSLREELPGMRVDLKPVPEKKITQEPSFFQRSKEKKVADKTLKLSVSIEENQNQSRGFVGKKLNTETEDLKLDKTNPKAYPEVVDAYSLHRFIIRKGKTLEETPEFQSYKRTFAHLWERIRSIIKSLEKLTQDYGSFIFEQRN